MSRKANLESVYMTVTMIIIEVLFLNVLSHTVLKSVRKCIYTCVMREQTVLLWSTPLATLLMRSPVSLGISAPHLPNGNTLFVCFPLFTC